MYRNGRQGERIWQSLGAAAVVALFIFAFATVVAAFRAPTEFLSGWVFGVIRFMLTFVGSVLAAILLAWLTVALWANLSRRIDRLERDHRRLAAQVKKGTPSFAVAIGLFAEVTVLLADKSFEGDIWTTLIVSFVLLVLYVTANILVNTQWKLARVVGYVVYVIGFLFLPIVLFWYHGWDYHQVWGFARLLEPITVIVFVLTWILYVTVPILANRLAQEDGLAA